MDVVDDLKKGYRKEIMVILSRFKDIIGYEDLKRLRILRLATAMKWNWRVDP